MQRKKTFRPFAIQTLLTTLLLLSFLGTSSLCAQIKQIKTLHKKSWDDAADNVLKSWKSSIKKFVTNFEVSKDRKKLDAELKKLTELDRQLARLSGKPIARDRKKEKRLHIFPQTPTMGMVIESNWEKQEAMLQVVLSFANLSAEKIDINADQIQLLVDGKKASPFKLKSNQYLSTGNGWSQPVSENVKKKLKIFPQKTGTITLRYSGFSMKTKIPQFRLIVKYLQNGKPKTKKFDLNRIEKARVKISSELIGPKNCLALITISGKLSCINVAHLISELAKFEEKEKKRYIVHFTKKSQQMDSYVESWLTGSVQSRGNTNSFGNYSQLPTLPGSSQQIFLAAVPHDKNEGNTKFRQTMYTMNRFSQQESVVLNSLDLAIGKALKPVYRNLPYGELVKEIESGHELCRHVALKLEGERLHDDQLPYVLKLSRDKKHPKLRNAAILVLASFEKGPSRDRLREILEQNKPKSTSVVVKAMASSRFSNIRYDLVKYFRSAPRKRQKAIIKELVKHPHPLWAEMIYHYLTADENSLNVEGIQALSAMGHPKLLEIYRLAFDKNNPALEKAVCEQLTARKDIASKKLIADYIRRQVALGKITDRTMTLAMHTNDQQIVPVLIAQLKDSKKNRSKLISTLGSIGDQTVATHLKKLYPSLKDKEKASALKAFQQLQTPDILDFAKDTLNSSNRALQNRGCQILVEDGSDRAISFLVKALKNTKSKKAWPTICSSLGNFFTQESKNALLVARRSSDKATHRAARQAIMAQYSHSPAYYFLYQGFQDVQEKKWKQAKRIFSEAIKRDPQLPISYLGRADVYLHLKKLKEARKDYEKSFQLDPYNSQALLGLCHLEIEEKKIEKAVSFLEKNEHKFEDDTEFHYGAARIYARLLASLDKTKDKKKKATRSKAVQKKLFANLKKLKGKTLYLSTEIEKEKDFKDIKDDVEFKKFVKKIKVVTDPSYRMKMGGGGIF